MSSSRFSPEIYRSIIHPAMSLAVTVTAVLAAVYLFSDLTGLPNPSLLTVTAIVLAVVVEAVAGNLLYRERAGAMNRFRELVIYLTVVYLVFSVTRDGPLALRFVPGADQLIPLIPVAMAWLTGYTVHDRLRGREGLLRTLEGKQHDTLRRAVLGRQHDMALTIKELRSVKKLVVALFVMLAILAGLAGSGVAGAAPIPVGSAGFILFALYSVSAAVVTGSVNSFIDEYASNGEGISLTSRFRRRRAIAAFSMVALVTIMAFALSRGSSLLPLDAFGRFFAWLGQLFTRRSRGPIDVDFTPSSPAYDRGLQLRNMLAQMEVPMPPPWIRLLVGLLRRLLAAVIVAAVVLFIFGPLFSPSFRKGLKGLRPGAFLKALWRRLVDRIRVFWRALRSGAWFRRRSGDERAPEDDRYAAMLPGEYRPSLRKRRQMDRVVAVFMAIARWGEKRGLRYTRNLTASEYLLRVPELYPERYVDARTVLETFHEARFSRRLVPYGQLREYVHAAKRITRESA